MKKALLLLLVVAAAVPLVGCGSGSSDDYDPNKIAVKQPGSGPPPMQPPGSPDKKP